MIQNIDLSTLVSKAQKGHVESRELLAAHVRQRVDVYFYRMTLDYHLAQDLTQETVLQMVKYLHHLKVGNNAAIWAWIYRTALGKLQHHNRLQGQRKLDHNTVVDHEKLTQMVDRSQDTVIIKAQRREMIKAITQSLNTLKLSYRSVLTLRCFEQRSYAEIATVTGGTEIQARLTFFRAKQALKRQLSRRGIKKDSMLSSLTLFGLASAMRTQRASAAAAVTSNLLTTSAATTVIGTATSPLGILSAALLILGFTVGAPHFYSRAATEEPKSMSTSALLEQSNATLASPAQILTAHDPDGNGWEQIILSDVDPTVWKSTDVKTIIQKQWHYFFLEIPQGHWLEFSFGGPITDGPGVDITYHCLQSGGLGKVYLTDGRGQLYQLMNPTIRPRLNWDYHIYFDLADANPPFQPVAVRIEGSGAPHSRRAFVLTYLRTRN
jgi:RNA polymerase sigma-70 factor (ECF subfamily)